MNGEEFGTLLKLLYGSHRGWQTRAGADLELHPSTIQKWIAGDRVPKMAELAVQYLRLRRPPGTKMKLLPAPELFVEGVTEIEGAVPDPPLLAPPRERVRTALGRRQRTRWP